MADTLGRASDGSGSCEADSFKVGKGQRGICRCHVLCIYQFISSGNSVIGVECKHIVKLLTVSDLQLMSCPVQQDVLSQSSHRAAPGWQLECEAHCFKRS